MGWVLEQCWRRRAGSLGTEKSGCCSCSLAQSCPSLCDSMGCSTPGFPIHHYLLEFGQIHVHWTDATIQPSHSLAPFSSCPHSFPASGSLPMSQLFESDGQSIGVSALASVFSTKFQGWFSSELTSLISLQCKGLSRVFSNTTGKKHQFFSTQLAL